MDRWESRKACCRIRVTDKAGKPAANTALRAELKNHEFLFGTNAFFSMALANGAAPEKQAYLERVYDEWKQTFNYATLVFYLGRYEPERGKRRKSP